MMLSFYHDKGGITIGVEGLANNMKKNLCSDNGFRLRRDEVKGTKEVHLLYNSGVIYGAILSGEHVFYILREGKEPQLDGHAKFTHLWLLTDGIWKMKRILSYDHGPAKYINNRKEIKLSAKTLDQFVGEYEGPQTKLSIQNENNSLTFGDKNEKSILYPETQNSFFMKERDIRFEFIKNGKNKVDKVVVRERGEIVEELTFKK